MRIPLAREGRAWLVLGLALACGAPDASFDDAARQIREAPPRPPSAALEALPDASVLVVILDACRPDKMSLYGYPRPTTPELERVAEDPDAVLFRRHYVQASWTKPSTASLFTGLYPSQHGVYRGTDSSGGTLRFRSQLLPAAFDTMAEHFQRRGYRTFSVVKATHLLPLFGFGQGFDEVVGPGEIAMDGDRVAAMLEFVRSSPDRFFGYLHLEGCHYPYEVETRDPEYMGEFAIAYDEAARQAAGIDFTRGKIEDEIEAGTRSLEKTDVEFLNLVYEAEMRFADRTSVGTLVRGLEEAGRWDDTLVVVSADHGEALFEHGGYGHGHHVWEELIHVPLLIKFPSGGRPPALGREVGELTSSIDLLPSLLALLGMDVSSALPGRIVFSREFLGYAYAESWKPNRHLRALVQGRWKLVTTPDEPLLFDLESDPRELDNRAGEDAETVAALERLVGELALPARMAPEVDHELPTPLIENLRALGYLPPDS